MCIHCGICVQNCPAGALTWDENGKVVWNKSKCIQCDTCLKVCPNNASPKITWMNVQDVMNELRRTFPYIAGITTSGGECTQHIDFLIELFSEVRKFGKTCLIDSNGSFDFENDPRVLQVCDGVMLDVKAYPREWHRYLVGQNRDVVLKNLLYLLKQDKLYEVRTLIFPGRDEENEAVVRYVSQTIGSRCFYKIIRYRPFGVREQYLSELGEFTTDEAYTQSYVELAQNLGASRAYMV